MSKIQSILDKLEGTSEYDILVDIEKYYEQIECAQKVWYEKSEFLCPPGCGSCCMHFEPDLMKAEALYMGAWLLENQPVTAYNVMEGSFPFPSEGSCPFFDPDDDYHCTIYGGRAFICRLFGASSVKAKDGSRVWKPCRFYPDELLARRHPKLHHRQYSQEEVQDIFGIIPPNMSDFMMSTDSGNTRLLRELLPQVIRHLLWIIDMNDNGNDHPNGSDHPNGNAA
ncbi:MAG: YkgJ family cysteine cluster protein [Spirochaetia bacterium]|nr:YkgJ family cysteine cluster protein [Spirochaetia bacterium]